jgi:hypothetical protein
MREAALRDFPRAWPPAGANLAFFRDPDRHLDHQRADDIAMLLTAKRRADSKPQRASAAGTQAATTE